MKSRENLVRLKRFHVNEKRRQILQLDMMIADFDRMATRVRRDNLKNSQADLAHQRQTADSLIAEAEAELSKAEMLETRDHKSRDIEGDRSAMIG